MTSATQTCEPVLLSHRRAIPIACRILLALWALTLVGYAALPEQTLVANPQASTVTFARTGTLVRCRRGLMARLTARLTARLDGEA